MSDFALPTSQTVSENVTTAPLVDVGIPAYGRPKYLVEAIESVRAQTFPSWRLTICDDSPRGIPNVKSVVEPYLGDPRIHYVPTRGALGEVPNTNGLIAAGHAPYVVILHDDDRLHPTYLQRRAAFMEAHPECGFCFSGFHRIDSKGANLGQWLPPVAAGVSHPDDFLKMLLSKNVVGPPVAAFVRRSAYEASDGYFFEDVPHADYDMWFRLALKSPVGHIPGADADYRVHPQATSRIHRPPIDQIAFFADRLIEFAERERPVVLSHSNPRGVRARLILEEVGLDLNLRGGDRLYTSRILILALRTYPWVIADRRVFTWLKIVIGGRAVRPLGRMRRRVTRRGRSSRLSADAGSGA